MPRLSDSMESGTVVEWLVAEGQEVEPGTPLVEIETDKTTVIYEAEVGGTLTTITVPNGSSAAVGAVIAVIAAVGDMPPASVQPAPAMRNVAPPRRSDRRVAASPVARRVALELGVDLAGSRGSGPNGRIVKADVRAAAAGRTVAVVKPGEPSSAAEPTQYQTRQPEGASSRGSATVEPLSRLQQTVARRMSESKATVPDISLSLTVDMTRAVEVRSQLKDALAVLPSYNDMVVKAAARALTEHPRVNAGYRDGHFELYSRCNVGIAVAAADALVVPTVFDADQKSLGRIALESRALADKVRAQTITPAELAGGTFTVSNLGMFGIEQFTAIVNQPQAAILTVGSLARRPAVNADGDVVARDQMQLCLVCDHRILYGADGARFLASVKALLEQPLALAM